MPKSEIIRLADSQTVRRGSIARRLNRGEAEALTAQIRSTASNLWQLVAVAYDRKAWQALGYPSWKDYATDELQMSESRSYQLVDTGRVMRAIGEVAGEDVFQVIQPVSARETARVKAHLSTFKKDLKAAIKDGMTPEQAIQAALANVPESVRVKPAKPTSPSEPLEGDVVDNEPAGTLLLDPVDLTALEEPEADRAPAPRPAPAPLFSTPTETPIRTFVVPAGRTLCSSCHGLGYE